MRKEMKSKSKEFKDWFSKRMGHSKQLKLAHDAITELEKDIKKFENLISECSDCGDIDSRLFNAYMEHSIKDT